MVMSFFVLRYRSRSSVGAAYGPDRGRRSLRVVLILLALCLCVSAVTAQALPTPVAPYRQAVPPYDFSFPRDHAAHPAFQTEWWYYTGHLASGGRRFGYELT